MPKPDIRRVVTFGTSLTARGGWQEPLARALSEAQDHAVEVEIVAQPGQDSRWALANVDRVIALSPDVVLMEFAINDASLLHLMPVRESRRNTVALISRLREGAPQAALFLMAMNPVWGRRVLIRPRLAYYYNQQAVIARDMGAGFIDHRPAWRRFSAAELRRAIPDGGHPKPAIAGQVMVPAIMAALNMANESDAAPPG